jgi:NAD(P)-dependent dehydrogenase (short-subunit alcohol dehydrogenase family)
LPTGGASGLGAATAAQLRKAGARVTILDQDENRARAHAKAIDATWCALDVADGPAVKAALADLNNLRVLVCCAGVGGGMAVVRRNGPHDLEMFERVVRVNLTGTFNCLRLAAWKMSQLEPTDDGERGVIVTTASIAGYDGVDGGAAYSASKAGVAGMTLPLARDLGRFGVRVMSIAPGTFTTPMTAGMPPDFDNQMRDTTPFPHRFGEPTEYAALVEHIVSNRMLNGEVIRLDGGLRMTPSRLR